MTTLLPLASRRSRFLLDWNAAACLAAPDQSLNAITGQVATFTRASVKTAVDTNGVVRTVPHSLPAFQWAVDPVSGLSTPGVLLEAARTNLCLQSETLGTTWTAASAVVGSNAATAPNRTLTADAIVTSAVDGGINQSFTKAASSLPYVFSIFVKAGGLNTVRLWIGTTNAFANGVKATFNLTLGTVATAAATFGAGWTAPGAGIEALGDGWYRCSVTGTSDTATTLAVAITTPTSGGGASGVYAWGGQLEQAASLTSYSATTTVAVTRVVDVLTLALNVPPMALTIYAKIVDAGYALTPNGTVYVVGNTNGSTPMIVEQNGGGYYHDGSVGQSGSALALTNARGDVLESVLTIDANADVIIRRSVNGGAAATGTTGTTAAVFAASFSAALLTIGAGNAWANGNIIAQTVRIAAGVQTLATMQAG